MTDTRSLTRLADAARRHAARGRPIFPVEPRGKRPLIPGGFRAATTDAAQVAAWWRQWPDANIGLYPAGAGVVVLDFDSADALASGRLLGCLAEPTLEVKTARGCHRYYRHPGFPVGNVHLADGIDLRADAGYVLAPPSVHPSGHVYQWSIRDVELADVPPAVLALLTQHVERPAAPVVAHVGDVLEGGRNAALAALAGAMRRRGASETAILAALLADNAARCKPPLNDAEVQGIARSIARYEPAAAAGEATEGLVLPSKRWRAPVIR